MAAMLETLTLFLTYFSFTMFTNISRYSCVNSTKALMHFLDVSLKKKVTSISGYCWSRNQFQTMQIFEILALTGL